MYFLTHFSIIKKEGIPLKNVKISFAIEGEPKGKARPRYTGNSAYTPPATKEYETQVGWYYKAASRGFMFPADAAIHVQIIAYFGIPKSASKAKQQDMLEGKLRPLKKCDADNIAKIILDGLNGIAYPDDKQITSLSVEKWYSDTPKVVVILSNDSPA